MTSEIPVKPDYCYPDPRCWQLKMKPSLMKDMTFIIKTTEGDICEVCPYNKICPYAGKLHHPQEAQWITEMEEAEK